MSRFAKNEPAYKLCFSCSVPSSGQITLIPTTGLWTTTTAGNIALATTAIVNRALILTWDSNSSKWYPSYT